jgi:hypothetical protein
MNILKIFSLLLLSFQALGFAPEMLGSSATSMGLGMITHGEKDLAASNANTPSFLAFDSKAHFSFNLAYFKPHFNSINNVVIGNEMNTDDGVEKMGQSNVPNSSENIFIGSMALPLFHPSGPKLGLTFFAPLDRLAEASSGDPYLPEYVMYRSRLSRSAFIFNLIQKYKNLGISLGGYSGFQASGKTFFVARTSGDTSPSSGQIDFNAKPSLAALFSLSYKEGSHLFSFVWQQQMKSRFETTASGFTPVGGGSLPFNLTMKSMAYYDPMILRLGYQKQNDSWRFLSSLQFEKWDDYETPRLKLNQNGGVIIGGSQPEKIKTKNIFMPQIAIEKTIKEVFYRIGYAYRASPLRKTHLKGSSNALDPDSHLTTLGLGIPLKIWDKKIEFSVGYQYRFLENRKIIKTDGQENGSAGRKIGAPGYRMGGNTQSLMVGLNWETP